MPFTEEYFRRTKNNSIGLIRQCKECCRNEHRERRKNNKDAEIKYRKSQKEYSQTIKGIYKAYKASAKAKNRYFELTLDDFNEYWQSDCYYCGTKLKTVGFDRINSNVGYIKSNILPCCTQCNTMKMNYSQEDFLYQCLLIVKRHFAKEGETI
jgi:hypothetical protein